MESVFRKLVELSSAVKSQTERKLHDTNVLDKNYERFANDSAYIPKIRDGYTAKRDFYEERLADSKHLLSEIQSTKRAVNRNLDDAILTLVKNEMVLRNVARNINRPKIGTLEALARETVSKHRYTDMTDTEKEVLRQPFAEKYTLMPYTKSRRRGVRKSQSLGGKSRRLK